MSNVSQTSGNLKNHALAGLVTGQIAGLIMAVVVMAVFTLFLGHSPLYPVQVIGSFVFGESGVQGFNFKALLIGLFLHQLGPSLAWGIAYGVLAGILGLNSTSKYLLLGLGVGVLSMIDVYLFVPYFMNSFHGVDIWNREVPMGWDWAAHIIFGLSLSFYPKIIKSII